MRLADRVREGMLFQSRIARYAFSLAAVAVAASLRIVLAPLTGRGAPFPIFFAATLVTSLLAGTGPAVLCVAISLPVAIALFVLPAGYPLSQAAFQALLYGIDGLIVVYLTILTRRRRLSLQAANEQLQRANDERGRLLERERETIDLAPDAYLVADLDARFTDANRAACQLLGYERDELVGKSAFDIIPSEDAARVMAVKAELIVPGRVSKAEWTLKRKDGTFVPVESSSNILHDGRWQAFVRDISERKRIEDLRQVFVSLLDNSSDFIGIADPAGKPIYVNAAGRRMVGLPPDSPAEEHQIEEFYPPELRSFVTDVILKAMIERGHWTGETQFRNFRTNAAIPVSDTHFLIRDTGGERILGMGTVTRDISEARRIADEREELLAREKRAREQAESANAQLREAEERFRLAIDGAPIGMSIVALDGRFVRVNRAFCEITGYSADELLHLTFQEITHPDDVGADVELKHRLARGDIPRYQLEKRYLRKDRSIVECVLNASVLRGPDGAARYFISQVEDITARKRADEAVRLSEAKFSGIVSIASDAIIAVDKDQYVTIFNEGAEKIFGYAARDVLGMALERLIPERFRVAHREHFAAFAAGEEAARKMGERREIFGLRKNGEEFPAEASISKVSVEGTMFFSVVLRDITYRKSVEAALERAVAARDDVLGIVAHDLRNPLSAITMAASLLERSDSKSEERRDQTPRIVISRSAERMNRLIQDLLDVAQVEAGQLKVEREPISAADLVRDAVEVHAQAASAAGVQLRFEPNPDVGTVMGDRNRLLQVFDNLVGNALKFTHEGGRITVGATAKNEDIVFSVADTGSGIAPENVAHIFERFWQAATRATRLGAGLGLPITRGIVEAHGGRIWVESSMGVGTTFFFTIPAAPPEMNRPADARPVGQSVRKSDRRRTRRQRS
jgi:PAS domain S-box-containing protein